MKNFPADTGNPVFYRTYSRRDAAGAREDWQAVCDRTIEGLAKLGQFTPEERDLVYRMQSGLIALTSGRWLWVGGTEWVDKPENFPGAYNCTNISIIDWHSFGLMMDFAMQGTGTGAVLEPECIDQLPPIVNQIHIIHKGDVGLMAAGFRREETLVIKDADQRHCSIVVGDSRKGWVDAYTALLDLASDRQYAGSVFIVVDLAHVRPAGEKLKGFGGTANPALLQEMFPRIANVLNRAIGRQLTAVECCLIIDEAARVVVAGNIRRCLPGDTLVSTDHGLIPIKDVQVGDLVYTPNGLRTVTNKFYQGLQNVYEFALNGGAFRATSNHKIARLKSISGDIEWIQAGDLRDGDRLLLNRQVQGGVKTALPVDDTAPRPENSHTCKSIVVPELSIDIAWLIGYCHGNGHVALGRNKHNKPYGLVSFSLNSTYGDAIPSRLKTVLKQFGVDAADRIMTKENTRRLTVSSIRLAEYFSAHVKQANEPIQVPSWILQASPEIRAGYLAGLYDSDGAQNNRPPIAVTTVYKAFAWQIAAVYASLGIPVRFSTNIPSNPNHKPKHDLKLASLRCKFNELIAPHSCKGGTHIGNHEAHGYTVPVSMARESLSTTAIANYGANGSPRPGQNTGINYGKLMHDYSFDIPITFEQLAQVSVEETWDIEVAGAHCFYANGILCHNSAGMRQASAGDEEFAAAKDNLWQQDADGSWRIDPDRDALRMANHTRVFHYRPSLDEVMASVTKQFYSGEGAIQFAPEAIARANADILRDEAAKHDFISLLTRRLGEPFLRNLGVSDDREIAHRLERYGFNPCFTPGTMIVTREGHAPIESLVGKTVEIFDGQDWRQIDNFRVTGTDQPVHTITMHDGSKVTATAYHKFILENGDRVELKDLKVGDHLLPHTLQIHGTHTEKAAYLKGFLIGDGTLRNGLAALDLYHLKWMCEDALIESAKELPEKVLAGNQASTVLEIGFRESSSGMAQRKTMRGLTSLDDDLTPWVATRRQSFPIDVMNWDLPSKLEFIAGAMDADGTSLDSSNGFGYQITSIHEEWLRGFQMLLKTIGVQSTLRLSKAGGTKDFGKRGGVCEIQPLYRLTISQAGAISLSSRCKFHRLQSFSDRKMKYDLNSRWNVIKSIEFSHNAPFVYCCTVPETHTLAISSVSVYTGNCGEITGKDFKCNLSEVHLNRIDPEDHTLQAEAFQAGALSVAALLHHRFIEERMQYSRKLDPIVGVSFTGLFDFFVAAFGSNWLAWWNEGRPETEAGKVFSKMEQAYLIRWREVVRSTVWDYCDRHGLKRPNRFTTVQPAGCLTGDALRVFDQGLLFADEHMEPEAGEVDVSEFGLTVRGGVTVTTAIANSLTPILRLTLANGRQLSMTTNHRLFIQGAGWVQADKMEPGMVVDYSIGEYRNARESALDYVVIPDTGKGRPCHPCQLPDLMSPQLAYFLGALFGNGHTTESHWRIRFSHGSSAVLEKISKLGFSLFGLGGTLTEDRRGGKFELCFANKQLYKWFEANGLLKTEKSKDLKRIPQKLRLSSRSSILAFFAGYIDCDGCIRKEGSLSIDSASEDFMRHLQQIGEAVGLSFSIFHSTQGENMQGEKNMWGLNLSRMMSDPESVGFLNQWSVKAQNRPIPLPKRHFHFEPYKIETIEPMGEAYTYDYAIDGEDDNDSWYWQGGLKSHNTKSLLTGASPGWHPPKAARYIRRITFAKDDPVAMACRDLGYSIIPGQSDKDETGQLLNDPFDRRCTEWLVEIPVKMAWADLPGCDAYDINQFSALAQFDFWMQVQRYYTTHNTSATIEIREHEIEEISQRIYKSICQNEGYVSTTLLPRSDAPFPRMPFEAIDRETYDRLMSEVERRKTADDFHRALLRHDSGESLSGPAGCDSDKCLLPQKDGNNGQ